MESRNVKLFRLGNNPRSYTMGFKREGAESYEVTYFPFIRVYDTPGEAVEAGKRFIELAGNRTNLIRGPYTGHPLENIEICALDITALIESKVIPEDRIRRKNTTVTSSEEQEKLTRVELSSLNVSAPLSPLP